MTEFEEGHIFPIVYRFLRGWVIDLRTQIYIVYFNSYNTNLYFIKHYYEV